MTNATQRIRISLLFSLLSAGAAVAADIPAEFKGTWKPQNKNCQGDAALVVNSDSFTLMGQGRRQRFSNIDLCYSCEGGARYAGIVVWATPMPSQGDAPFIVKFNADEKKGVTVVEVGDEQLAKAFPLTGLPLQKCP
jgi:hypothetical protein